MSKKETEFDRIERMNKLRREASVVERRKSMDFELKQRSSKPKLRDSKRIIISEYEEEYEYMN